MKPPPNPDARSGRGSGQAARSLRRFSAGAVAGVFGLLVLLPAFQLRAQTASPFSIQIVDGLNQPVPGVLVEVFRTQKETNGTEQRIELGKAVSESDGIAAGTYDKSSIPTNETFSVALSKDGYAGYTSGPGVDYVLKRLYHASDVARILQLPTDQQRRELRDLLAGEMDPTGPPLNELIFARESPARPTLRWLLDDPLVGPQAGELLAFIGQPDDVRLLVQFAPEPNGDPAVNRWTYAVASALLSPSSEREWAFLRHCGADNYGDHWADAAAIRTLRLIASPRSRQILEDLRQLNPARTNEINRAIAYIDSNPAPLTGKDAAAAAARLAQALDAGTSMGNEAPRFSDRQDAALVDCDFLAGGSQFLVFTATLQQEAGVWHVRGVRQTRQTFLPKPAGKTAATNN